MRAYLCVSIDCECDKGPRWRTRKPLSFSAVTDGIRERLQPLFRRHHAKPTYLLSPEILRDTRATQALATLDGDAELGTHLHGEFAEPGAFEPDVTSAFQCHYDRATEHRKLSYLTNLFREAFGRAPRSFRAGRFGIGQNSLGLLQELGYAVDSSVTPHKDWTAAGAPEASFLCAPTQPYWPVLDAPEQPATSPGALLEVPVTIRPSLLGQAPLIGRFIEPRWLRPTWGRVDGLIALARDEIKAASDRSKPVVLNCMFHNVEITAGTSPYANSASAADAILARLAGLLTWAERESIPVIGLGDVPDLF